MRLGFEGSGVSDNYHLNEAEQKKERIRDARIWIVLSVIFLLIFGYAISIQISDYNLKTNGNHVYALRKSDGTWENQVYDEEGNVHKMYLSAEQTNTDKDRVDLYYWDKSNDKGYLGASNNIGSAKMLTEWEFLAVIYLFAILGEALCIFRIYRCVYGKQKHAIISEEESKRYQH